jgi:hypothetical protein
VYARYLKTRVGADAARYELQDDQYTHLFGCKEGFVPWLLRPKLTPEQNEPCEWHVDVASELAANAEYPNSTLLIDLKPKQNKTNLSLYEVMDVWGYSDKGWSPILLRLKGLFVDAAPSSFDRKDFIRKDRDTVPSIYEFLYLKGSIRDGELDGRWTAPPASPTNAALLWPESLNYFFKCIRATTPEFLEV